MAFYQPRNNSWGRPGSEPVVIPPNSSADVRGHPVARNTERVPPRRGSVPADTDATPGVQANGAPTEQAPVIPHIDVDAIRPTAGEVKAMDGNQFAVSDPFGMGSVVATMSDEVQRRLGNAAVVVDRATENLDQIQDRRTAELTNTIKVKDALNQTMQSETQAVIARAQPLFQSREAIRARRQHLNDMNPLARAVAGIFNPNYNDRDLEARDGMLKDELEAIGQEHEYITRMQSRLSDLAQSSFNDHDALAVLEGSDILQDVQMVMQGANLSKEILGAGMDRLQNQMGLLSAQHQARQITLSQMSEGQLNLALDAATQSPDGYATINGVPMSVGTLRTQLRTVKDQYLDLEARGLAITSNRMDVADKYQDRIIQRMSADQIREALANGGTFQGQQLSMQALTQQLPVIAARDTDAVQQQAAETAIPQLQQQMQLNLNYIEQDSARATSLFGTMPPPLAAANNQFATQLHNFMQQAEVARTRGQGVAWLAVNQPRIQALFEARDAAITNYTKNWAGGDDDVAAVAGAWIRGNPITGEAALRGLIRMARTGLPNGVNLTGASLRGFQAAQEKVQAYYTTAAQNGRVPNQREIPVGLMQQVQSAVSDVYVNGVSDSIIQSTQRIAADPSMNQPNGQPHPLAAMSQERFQMAMAHGDREGYTRMAQELGISPEEAQRMIGEGPTGDTWRRVGGRFNWGTTMQVLQARQVRSTLEAMDADGRLPNGQRPSDAYVAMLNDPRYQSRVADMARALGSSSSFGNYVLHSIGGGNFTQQYQGFIQNVTQAQAARNAGDMQSRIQRARAWSGHSGTERMGLVISSMEGVGDADRQRLIEAARGQANTFSTDAVNARYGPGVAGEPEFDALQNVILNGHFDDPQLEALRRRVATRWQTGAATVDRIQNAISNRNAQGAA